MLQQKFGSRVEDLLQNTALEQYARQLSFGMHIVRGAMDETQCTQHMVELSKAIAKIASTADRLHRAVNVQGENRKTRWYTSVQACSKLCICKYEFEGVGRHVSYKLHEVPILQTFFDWIHGLGDLEEALHMNEVLGNVYDRADDEYIPWHSDLDSLYENSTDVLSWSVGSPGIFCFRPRDNEVDDTLYRMEGSKGSSAKDKRERAIAAGLRGLVPVFAGDIILMSGRCQVFLKHKTQQFSDLSDIMRLLKAYPATLQSSKDLMHLVCAKPELEALANRGNFTARRIYHHKAQPIRCPELPALGSGASTAVKKRQRDSTNAGLVEPAVALATPIGVEVVGHKDVPPELQAHVTHILDVDVWLRFFETVVAGLGKIYDGTPTDKRYDISSQIDALYQKSMQYRQSRGIAQIRVDAVEKLQALKYFEGARCTFTTITEPRVSTDEEWTRGIMGGRKSRSLRCLTTVGAVMEIIRNGNDEAFRIKAHFKVDIESLSDIGRSVYWLQSSQKQKPTAFGDMFGSTLTTNTLELGFNYSESMQRIQPRPLGKGHERRQRYIKALGDAVVREKKRQMQIEDKNAWPQLPWKVESVWSMPMVLWIHKKQ